MIADSGKFYLATLLDMPEYIHMPVELIPEEFIDANNLTPIVRNEYIYMKSVRGIYGLP